METLTIPKILSTLKERNEIATKKGYDNFSHMVLWNDKFFIRETCCQSALKSIHLTASNNVQQVSKVIPFLAPFYAA
jgi:hypothetical protein